MIPNAFRLRLRSLSYPLALRLAQCSGSHVPSSLLDTTYSYKHTDLHSYAHLLTFEKLVDRRRVLGALCCFSLPGDGRRCFVACCLLS